MIGSLELTLCNTQGELFVLSAERGYSSESFIRAYMTSQVSADMDKTFNHMQWAGRAYILSRMEDELSRRLRKGGMIFENEALYWIGYTYRYWHYHTGENSKEIYKQAPVKAMKTAYLRDYHMPLEAVIKDLKDAYVAKK